MRAVKSEESVIEERINDPQPTYPQPGVHQGTSEEPEVQIVEPESKTRRKTRNLHLSYHSLVTPSPLPSFLPSLPPPLPPEAQ